MRALKKASQHLGGRWRGWYSSWCPALACTIPQGEAYTPPPDPQALLNESAEALRDVQSMKFRLIHQRGSIYTRDDAGAHIKATEINGAWDDEAGLSLVIDAYLVRSHNVEATSGSYFPLSMILVQDGLYITDPLSGQWVLQSPEFALIPVEALNEMMADFVSQIDAPNLEGVEDADGRSTYRVSGSVPASAVDWLPIDLTENTQADIILWINPRRSSASHGSPDWSGG